MKLIFLDFDGILFTLRSGLLLKGITKFTNDVEPDWPAVRAIAQKCNNEGWQIIPITTWMQLPEDTLKVLTQVGLHEFLHPQWRTSLYTNPAEKIETYLKIRPEINAWMILDDCDYNWTPVQRSHWIQGCMFQGLTYRQLEQLENFGGLAENKLNWLDWSLTTPPVQIPLILRDKENMPWKFSWTTARQQMWEKHTFSPEPGINTAIPRHPENNNPAVQWAPANIQKQTCPATTIVTASLFNIKARIRHGDIRPETRKIPANTLIPVINNQKQTLFIPAGDPRIADWECKPIFNGEEHAPVSPDLE